jgi:hypothetical protein
MGGQLIERASTAANRQVGLGDRLYEGYVAAHTAGTIGILAGGAFAGGRAIYDKLTDQGGIPSPTVPPPARP